MKLNKIEAIRKLIKAIIIGQILDNSFFQEGQSLLSIIIPSYITVQGLDDFYINSASAIHSSQHAEQFSDGFFACFDAFGQLELHPGTMEVLAFVSSLEVDVSCQVVGEEAEAEFEGD